MSSYLIKLVLLFFISQGAEAEKGFARRVERPDQSGLVDVLDRIHEEATVADKKFAAESERVLRRVRKYNDNEETADDEE